MEHPTRKHVSPFQCDRSRSASEHSTFCTERKIWAELSAPHITILPRAWLIARTARTKCDEAESSTQITLCVCAQFALYAIFFAVDISLNQPHTHTFFHCIAKALRVNVNHGCYVGVFVALSSLFIALSIFYSFSLTLSLRSKIHKSKNRQQWATAAATKRKLKQKKKKKMKSLW